MKANHKSVPRAFMAWAPVVIWMTLITFLGTRPALFPRYARFLTTTILPCRPDLDLSRSAPHQASQSDAKPPGTLPALHSRFAVERSVVRGVLARMLLNKEIIEVSGHFAIYAALGWLLARARHMSGGRPSSWAVLIFIACLSAVDEYLQTAIPTRQSSIQDWGVDLVGALAGMTAWSLLKRVVSNSPGLRPKQ